MSCIYHQYTVYTTDIPGSDTSNIRYFTVSLSLSLSVSLSLSLCLSLYLLTLSHTHSVSLSFSLSLSLDASIVASKNSDDLDRHTSGFELVYSMAGLGGAEADEGVWVDTSNLFINLTWIQFGLVKIIAAIYLSTYLFI